MSTVKTAISIDSNIFKKVEKLSSKIKLSRSQIFSQAVEYFITKTDNLELLNKINEAYSDLPNESERNYLKKAKRNYKSKVIDKW